MTKPEGMTNVQMTNVKTRLLRHSTFELRHLRSSLIFGTDDKS
jgi:hypothetical protein